MGVSIVIETQILRIEQLDAALEPLRLFGYTPDIFDMLIEILIVNTERHLGDLDPKYIEGPDVYIVQMIFDEIDNPELGFDHFDRLIRYINFFINTDVIKDLMCELRRISENEYSISRYDFNVYSNTKLLCTMVLEE